MRWLQRGMIPFMLLCALLLLAHISWQLADIRDNVAHYACGTYTTPCRVTVEPSR